MDPSAAFEATENHFRRWLTKGKEKQRRIKTIRFFFQSCVENQCILCSYSYKYITDTLHLTHCILNLFSSLKCFRHLSMNSTPLILATIFSPVVLTDSCDASFPQTCQLLPTYHIPCLIVLIVASYHQICELIGYFCSGSSSCSQKDFLWKF